MTARANLPMDEIERRYRGGESAVKIAARFGVTTSTITRHLRKRGIVARGANHRAYGIGGPSTSMLRDWSSEMLDHEFDEWSA